MPLVWFAMDVFRVVDDPVAAAGLCPFCHKHPRQAPHVCPYGAALHDSEEQCECCEDCETTCREMV